MAVDAAPCPINWQKREPFVFFAGIVIGIAAEQGVKLRWGGDWDSDRDLKDQIFFDLPHFEIIED
jgi:peptidoglycan L-alanyl-D-glutamate endopeptidase CwlK